ncbi:MAG TPA: DUF2461 family protein, partial [Bacteroidales bacterium]
IDSEAFGEILDRFEKDGCALYGEDYKKKFSNDLPKRFQPWIQKRNFYVSRTRPIDDLFFSDRLRQEIAEIFAVNVELYRFLMECVE